MKLFIARHGETHANKEGLMLGQVERENTNLNKFGKEQAKKLASHLKDEHIDAIFSSDLQRAVDTTKEIAKSHPKVEILFDERIRERFYGELEGGHPPETWDEGNLPDGVEPLENVGDRVRGFLSSVYPRYKDKTVVTVCHGAVIKTFLRIFHELPDTDPAPQLAVKKNTALSLIEYDKKGDHNIHFINSTGHLE